MKTVLVLGAGMVTRPLVDYLLKDSDLIVRVGDMIEEKAERLVAGHNRGRSLKIDMMDIPELNRAVAEADLVISLVPYSYHPRVAELCIENRVNMVTASYVSDTMKSLTKKAKDAGILILNEIGLDPGIDHMSAMRIIHGIRDRGGHIQQFYSYAGGLPAPEANNNPFGYKFSWSPRGVVLAGRNAARYLKNGSVVNISSEDLFAHYWLLHIAGIGSLEAYANRNSIPYIDLYGLQGIDTLFRGTLRYPGWCDTWKKMAELGLLSLDERGDLREGTYRKLVSVLSNIPNHVNLKKALARRWNLSEDSELMNRLDWLGLFSDEKLPGSVCSPLDILAVRLQEKLQYMPGERDMIVLYHHFEAVWVESGRREKITSTLIDYGIPGEDSSMARTVSLPAAIAGRLILEGKIHEKGIQIPVLPSVYRPVLNELEKMNITFKEEVFDEL
ncbi:MAG TPA: saccharopine dehydrogenase [bacterium]|nr:saccharopine dehydrogenase [bacterium]